jgi:hypothetical protein
LPIEVGDHHDGIAVGHRRFENFARGAGALEGRRRQERHRIPADALAGLAAVERSLVDVCQTARD